jgi:hypothetical protein
MALKVTVATLDDVQEGLREFYTETEDGSFILQVEGVDNHPDVRNLKNAYTSEKAKRAEQAEKLRDALAKLEAKPEPTAKDEAEMVRLRASLEAERDAALAKASELEKRVYGLTVETQLDGMIREAGIIDPVFAELAKDYLAKGVKITEAGPIVETDMGPLPLAEHVKRWVAGKGKALVAPGTGGGASGNNGGMSVTVTKETFAAMGDKERIELFRTDPETFKRLSAA